MKFLVLTVVTMEIFVFSKVKPLALRIDNFSEKSAAFELKRNGTASSETLSGLSINVHGVTCRKVTLFTLNVVEQVQSLCNDMQNLHVKFDLNLFIYTFLNVGLKKDKVQPRTGQEAPDSYTLSLTSALDWVGGQRHAPATIPPGKNPVAFVKEAGWATGHVWKGAENLAPTGIRPADSPAPST